MYRFKEMYFFSAIIEIQVISESKLMEQTLELIRTEAYEITFRALLLVSKVDGELASN